jgi:hypothetical protein
MRSEDEGKGVVRGKLKSEITEREEPLKKLKTV